jgi:trigger factor
LFDLLDAGHSFELPKGMVDAEFGQIWRQLEADREAGRLDPEDAGKSDEALQAEYRAIAERRVRLGLILAEIGRRNKVEVREEEVAAAVGEQARRFPGQERQVVEFYQKNPAALAQIRAPIYEEKVVDFILELAKVNNVDVSREELFAEDEAEPKAASA